LYQILAFYHIPKFLHPPPVNPLYKFFETQKLNLYLGQNDSMPPKTDPRIDDYIANSAEFAQPILNHLRNLTHSAFPAIQETIKWGMPFFDYKGTVCSMASFKEHCTFGFWKSSLLPDPYKLLKINSGEAMGQFGKIKSLQDLPEDHILIEYIQNAIKLNEEGKKITKKATERTEIVIPTYLAEALHQNEIAASNFERFSYAHKKEYVQWIEEAKTESTKLKRLQTTMELLTQGKSRNWKYEK
jgi:uncharacterized protein YdeI (YjbR/CyaY-like superfamily)